MRRPAGHPGRRRWAARKRRRPDGQLTFLPPEDAVLLHLVRENLRLLSELRSHYRSAPRGGPLGRQVRSPADIADLLVPEMGELPQEQLRVVLLDTRNRVLDVVMVYQGSVSKAVARMAELFRDAVVANAPGIVLVHNHPSGDPSPTEDDIRMTTEAARAGQLLGIELLDHVILGRGQFVSLKEQGVL